MFECSWRKVITDETGPFFTGGDLDPDMLQTLLKEADGFGADIDSVDVEELGMVAEDSERAKDEMRRAAGACACDGSGCKVVEAVGIIIDNRGDY